MTYKQHNYRLLSDNRELEQWFYTFNDLKRFIKSSLIDFTRYKTLYIDNIKDNVSTKHIFV